MRTATTVRGAAQVLAVLVGTAVILLPGGPLGPLPAAAAAQVVTACPGPGNPITVDTELGANLVAGPADNPCVAFGADTIRLRLRGFAIDMRNVLGATAIAPTCSAQAPTPIAQPIANGREANNERAVLPGCRMSTAGAAQAPRCL